MSSTSDTDTEILLGNKHLLGIFFVVAILIGIAFTGGFMVGRNTAERKQPLVINGPAEQPASTQATVGGGPETHSVAAPSVPDSGESASTAVAAEPPPLGARRAAAAEEKAPDDYAPQGGQMFLQVTAVEKEDAYAVADVLSKKGFHAHAVAKSGTKLYRVLVGPVRDAADLSSTRDALRKTGFRDVIVQRY